MNLTTVRILLACIAIVGIAAVPGRPAGAGSLKEVLAAAPESIPAEVRLLIRNLAPEQRQALLNDQARFQEVIDQEVKRAALLKAAEAGTTFKDPDRAFLLRRQIEQLTINAYLQEQQNGKLEEGYPGNKEVREYYDKNLATFAVEERRHVSQIFLPLTPEMDEKARAAREKQAEDIAQQLNHGKITFEAAARQYSAHDASRLNGGYLGLLKMSSLVPEIRTVVEKLDPGKVAGPIRTGDGFHIVSAGDRVAAQTIAFADAENGIRQLLLKQRSQQIQQDILEQTLKAYPPPGVSEAERQSLFAELKASAQKAE